MSRTASARVYIGKRVLGGAVDAEELDLGAERQHEVVVGERAPCPRTAPRAAARSMPVTAASCTVTFGCSWNRSRSGCPTADGSSRSVATWYRSGWNVW